RHAVVELERDGLPCLEYDPREPAALGAVEVRPVEVVIASELEYRLAADPQRARAGAVDGEDVLAVERRDHRRAYVHDEVGEAPSRHNFPEDEAVGALRSNLDRRAGGVAGLVKRHAECVFDPAEVKARDDRRHVAGLVANLSELPDAVE